MDYATDRNEEGTPQVDSSTTVEETSTQASAGDQVDTSVDTDNVDTDGADQGDSGEKSVGLKGQERFSKLASTNRELSRRQEFEQRRDAILGNSATPQQPQAGGYQGQGGGYPGLNPVASQVILARAELQSMKDEKELEKAAKHHPELDVDSEDYDKDFHDHAWDIAHTEGIPLKDAADRYKQSLKKFVQRELAKREVISEEKSANSNQGGQKRTKVAGSSAAAELSAARERFNKTGSWEDLQKIRRLEYEQGN